MKQIQDMLVKMRKKVSGFREERRAKYEELTLLEKQGSMASEQTIHRIETLREELRHEEEIACAHLIFFSGNGGLGR